MPPFNGVVRFGPQWAPAPGRGALVCWTHSGSRIKLKRIDPSGAMSETVDLTAGRNCTLAADAQDSPRRAAQLRETYRRLLHALDRLPREMRATVVLVTLQGFNHAEAAIIQDCSAGTIAWRIHKARQRLRKALVKAPRCMTPAAHDPPLQALSSDLRELLEQCDLPALSPA